ncbi:hypothetical protein JCM10296v2_003211 [Rhodotorula toruloides]
MSASPPPRASLDGLPIETKTRISELCDRQDSAVGAMFELGKSWSTLSAPYRFKTIKVSKTPETLFQLYIAPKYGRFFRQIDFDDARLETFRWSEVVKQRPIGLGRLLTSLLKLDLDIISDSNFSRVVDTTQNLRSLRLSGGRPSWSGQRFVEVIAGLPLLLDLEIPTPTLANILQAAVRAAADQNLPRLQSYKGPIGSDLATSLAFPTLFAHSLQHLAFDSHDVFNEAVEMPVWPERATFPHVRSLTIKAASDEDLHVLDGFRPTSLATASSPTTGTSPATFARNFTFPGTFRHIRLFVKNEALQDYAAELVPRWFDLPGSRFSTNPVEPFVDVEFFSAISDRQDIHDGTYVSSAQLAKYVDCAMDFLVDWQRRAADTSDAGAYARLAVVLQRAELERVAMLG